MPGATNLSYDNAGHLLTIDHRTLTYNAWGQLETVTESDPVQGYPLWRVRYAYDSLGRRIRRDYDELGYLSTQDPNGPFEILKKDSRWYDYDGDSLIGENQIDRRFVFRPIAAASSVTVPDAGNGSLGLLAQQFEHSPFAARSDLSDSSDYAPVSVRGPFADPFAVVASAGNTSVLSGVGGGGSYTSYTGSSAESIVAGICVGIEKGEYDPTGQLASVYNQSGGTTWLPPYALDGFGNDNGSPTGGSAYAAPPSYPFTTAGGYRDRNTLWASNPSGGMSGAHDTRTSQDAEDDAMFDSLERGRNPLYNGYQAKVHQLSGHGLGALQFVANMLPPTNVITALTGRDGATGECVSVGGRVMAGMSIIPVEGLIADGVGAVVRGAGKLRGPRYTILYRAAGPEEIADIVAVGGFRQGGNSMPGKWFAESAEGAADFGRGFFKWDGDHKPFDIVAARIRTSAVKKMEFRPNLDGLGPARYLDLDDFNPNAVREIWFLPTIPIRNK